MSTSAMGGNGTSKEEYMKLLDQILRTDVRSKAATMLENAIGVKTKGIEKHSRCSLSQGIKYTVKCIKNLQHTGDSLMGSFLATSDSYMKPKSHNSDQKKDFVRVSRTMLNMVVEVVTISRQIHENASGLHIATDFLRTPRDIEILNFSRCGRVPIQHYSSNEASTISLTWLHSTATQWIKTLQEEEPKVSSKCIKAFSFLKDAILHLRDASELSNQVFRVLMYCNIEGKILLREYVEKLKFDEINDIITELQVLRRKFDQINILLEQLGWGLADICTRFTGNPISFESLLRVSQDKLNPFGDGGFNESVQDGVKNLKNKIKAGLETYEKQTKKSSAYVPLELYKTTKKKTAKDSKAEHLRRELEFKTKLIDIFGIGKNTTISEPTVESCRRSEANSFKPGSSPPTPDGKSPDRCTGDQGVDDINGQGDKSVYLNANKQHTRSFSNSSRSHSNIRSSFSKISSYVPTSSSTSGAYDMSGTNMNRNLILSNMFQEQLQGITHMMTQPEATAARASFSKFLREHHSDANFDFFKHKFNPDKNVKDRPDTSKN